MTTALLIYNGHNAQTHSGVIRLFGLNFVITGIVSKEQSKFYSKLFELRQTGDYDDLYNLTEEEVKPLIGDARNYIENITPLPHDCIVWQQLRLQFRLRQTEIDVRIED